MIKWTLIFLPTLFFVSVLCGYAWESYRSGRN